jgi:hypothetical protein
MWIEKVRCSAVNIFWRMSININMGWECNLCFFLFYIDVPFLLIPPSRWPEYCRGVRTLQKGQNLTHFIAYIHPSICNSHSLSSSDQLDVCNYWHSLILAIIFSWVPLSKSVAEECVVSISVSICIVASSLFLGRAVEHKFVKFHVKQWF